MLTRFLFCGSVFLWAGFGPPAMAADPVPLPRTHAHNDYEHPHPLRDALEHGFCSVEADIWLVDGKLLVAHNREQVKPERTLEGLYLEPLRERAKKNGGRIFAAEPRFWLLIDVKSEADKVWPVLREVLQNYADLLTQFEGEKIEQRAVTAVLSGNRPRELVAAQKVRLTAIDGVMADLEANPSPALVPWISENWNQHFKWRGQGAFPVEEKNKLKQIIERSHGQKRLVRFWGAPDKPPAWRELLEAGADLINSDDLEGLEKFLLEQKK